MRWRDKTLSRSLVALLAAFWLTGAVAASHGQLPASGRTGQAITPADVLARVQLLSAEVGEIRRVLGKPERKQRVMTVRGAAPREVYFGAQSLFRKSNDLAYEVTGGFKRLPREQAAAIRPMHVWQLINAALERIGQVKRYLNITTQLSEQVQSASTTPTDVYNAILLANQQVDRLLYRQLAPSDVYEQVTMAVLYTSDLLTQMKVSPAIPKAPPLLNEKRPSDVFQRLLVCYQILQNVAKQSDVKMLTIHVDKQQLMSVLPSHVYDLVKIIVSEVRYMDALLPSYKKKTVAYPGYKTPSQVYQQLGVLQSQLEQLEAAVSKDPHWLSR